MGPRKASIDSLLRKCDQDLLEIQKKYETSLANKSIENSLRILIKNYFENLRSVLEYLAKDIREVYCKKLAPGGKLYFPICKDKKTFISNSTKSFPDLKTNKPDLWTYLESIQPYNNNYLWLGHFNFINNENKHDDLVEQTKTVTREVKVSSDTGSVSYKPDNVRFGSGVSVLGAPVDPRTQRPVPTEGVKVQEIDWVDFKFSCIDISALGLIQQSIKGIKEINSFIQSHLTLN